MNQNGFIVIPVLAWWIIGTIVIVGGAAAIKSGLVTVNLPVEVECPAGTVKTQFGNNFECLTKQEPTLSPSPTSTSTTKPQVIYKQLEPTPKPTTDPDPIINCKAPIGSKCEGQSSKERKSICLNSPHVCCQVNNSWQFKLSGECTTTQTNSAGSGSSRDTSQTEKASVYLSSYGYSVSCIKTYIDHVKEVNQNYKSALTRKEDCRNQVINSFSLTDNEELYKLKLENCDLIGWDEKIRLDAAISTYCK